MAWNYNYSTGYQAAPQQNLYGYQCSSYNFHPTTETIIQRVRSTGTVGTEVFSADPVLANTGEGSTAKRTYVFKIINPQKKSEYVTRKFRTDCTFHTPEELRDKMYEIKCLKMYNNV